MSALSHTPETHFHRVLMPGSYDPVTVGHLDLITRASALADEVWVGVFVNPDKTCRFSPEKRVALLRAAVAHLPRVTVVSDTGYVSDYCRAHGVDALVKGYRSDTDLAYERVQEAYNLAHGAPPTLFLPADPALLTVSSTEVRRRLEAGEDLRGLVPDPVLRLLGR